MTPDEVKQLRIEAQMTQSELAAWLGLRSKTQVSHLESGRTPASGPVLRLLDILREQVDARISRKKSK